MNVGHRWMNAIDIDNKLKEECGVFGIRNANNLDCANIVYGALYALQHRGEESCGIAVTNDDGTIAHKDLGLVNEVFDKVDLTRFKGNMAIGHVRYSTTGGNSRENAQPFCIKYCKGILAIAHNGNIKNSNELTEELAQQGAIFQSTSDTECLAYLFAKERLKTPSIEQAISNVVPMLKGSFSLLIMSPKKLIAVRDPMGMRPLCMGKIDDSYVFASESCALDAIGAEFIRDVEPGEMIVVSGKDMKSIRDHCGKKTATCIFEHIYFARPDSVIDGQSVHEARLMAGRLLAEQYPIDADVVVGVPDSGLIAAQGYAEYTGIRNVTGLIKNRYIGRTFILPEQSQRERFVKIKLNALSASIKGKRVILIDDSIVRGTTSTRIVNLIRSAGAKEVHLMVSAPKFLNPCYYGTDVPSSDHLIATNRTVEEIAKIIGVDSLHFLSLASVEKIAPNSKTNFCHACFSGAYPENN